MSLSAGIDLGGTKIYAAVFDPAWQPLFSHRIATPRDSYHALLSALVQQIEWASRHADIASIGLGVPGVLDRESQILRAANLTADGHPLADDLRRATGVNICLINDSKAFALSEACLGAGAEFCSVLGVSIGTGTAAGLVVGKNILSEAAGMAGEIGHMSIPVMVMQTHKLPVLRCACGKSACYETFISGPGLTRLGQAMFDCDRTVEMWSSLHTNSDSDAVALMAVWYRILASMIADTMLCYDPECIVFGGGLSALPSFVPNLINALNTTETLSHHLPALLLAGGNEYSAARGAALQASR